MIGGAQLAHEYMPPETEDGSNESDDREVAVFLDGPENATEQELHDALAALNDDEMTEVLALVWVGRGDYDADEWAEAVAAARDETDMRTPQYLMGIPDLGDLLAEGLGAFGVSLESEENQHT